MYIKCGRDKVRSDTEGGNSGGGNKKEIHRENGKRKEGETKGKTERQRKRRKGKTKGESKGEDRGRERLIHVLSRRGINVFEKLRKKKIEILSYVRKFKISM